MANETHKTRLIGLYIRNLGAIPLGALIVGVLNLFTPLEFIEVQKAFLFGEKGWIPFIFFHPSIICIVGILQYMIQRPISDHLRSVRSGRGEDRTAGERAKRRLVNLPFILISVNMLTWILMPGLIVLFFGYFTGMESRPALLLFFRALMIGIVSSMISFFMVENFLRDRLIPYFFPQGRLASVPGTMKISIRRRIRVLYGAGTINPMIILVGTLLFTYWRAEGSTVSPSLVVGEVLVFTAVLYAVFILIALRLNFLVGKFILKPVGRMLHVMGQVGEGDYSGRIPVVSNDELGILGDAGNDMIAGLQERERIRDAFGKYVSPEIRDEILAGRIPLKGERKKATLLFSDLRDFTSYVEGNDPEEVISSTRAYFTAMEQAVRKHHGIVLQFVGDEVEAVFGVPLSYHGHADKAVMAALEMRDSLETLNRKRTDEGKAPFRHGIGIHTGEILAGNTGSDDRLSYTLVGDTVNLASRIQTLTKEIKCDILASQETVSQLKDAYQIQKQGPRKVKGYSRPIIVHRIL